MARLNAAGTGLEYGTFLGGSNTENATTVALDDSGRAVAAGISTSSDFGFGWSLGMGYDPRVRETVPTNPAESILGMFVAVPFTALEWRS